MKITKISSTFSSLREFYKKVQEIQKKRKESKKDVVQSEQKKDSSFIGWA